MHLPPTVKHIVIQAGTNNIDRDSPLDIALGIMSVAAAFKEKSTKPKIIVTGLIPRALNWSPRRRKITDTNKIIENLCKKESQVIYMQQDSNWININQKLITKYYFRDHLHLVE